MRYSEGKRWRKFSAVVLRNAGPMEELSRSADDAGEVAATCDASKRAGSISLVGNPYVSAAVVGVAGTSPVGLCKSECRGIWSSTLDAVEIGLSNQLPPKPGEPGVVSLVTGGASKLTGNIPEATDVVGWANSASRPKKEFLTTCENVGGGCGICSPPRRPRDKSIGGNGGGVVSGEGA